MVSEKIGHQIAGVLKFGRRGLIANQLGRNDASVRITSPASCVCRQALKVVKKIEPVRWKAVGRHHRSVGNQSVVRYFSYKSLNPPRMRVIETAHQTHHHLRVKCI